MKYLLFLFLLLCTINSAAQVTGTVTDSASRLPISNVKVISNKATVLTNEFGKFSLENIAIGDKLSFRIMGYEPQEMIVKKENTNISIKLVSKSIDLREVNIKTKRNYKKDSLALRKEYAAVFAYKAPNFTDMFVKVDPSYRSPHANINPNSTASILKFNALSAFSFFNKKKNSTSKLKSSLLKDEELNYVDSRFSKAKIELITSLKGDSLISFMQLYRPSYAAIKQMNDYQIILHIKKSYSEFIKPKDKLLNIN